MSVFSISRSRKAICLAILASFGCSTSMDAEPTLTVKGEHHTYLIPVRYSKSADSALYLGLKGGDESISTALLIPEIAHVDLDSSFSIYLLLFHDKVYSQEIDYDLADNQFTQQTGKGFRARITKPDGLDIEGITTVSKASCQILSVYDGILIQATVVDDVCDSNNLSKIKESQDRLVESWKADQEYEAVSTPAVFPH